MWRESLDRLEGGVNKVANRNVETEQFAQALGQFSKAWLGLHHVSDKARGRVYEMLDMPSRTEIAALAAAIQRVEDKLDMLLPPAHSLAPRPARTRRPPESLEAAAGKSATENTKTEKITADKDTVAKPAKSRPAAKKAVSGPAARRTGATKTRERS